MAHRRLPALSHTQCFILDAHEPNYETEPYQLLDQCCVGEAFILHFIDDIFEKLS
ncbi:hypothetical protein [Rubritalea tangerina]|uniref:hypothetical protein n=1 Tax=Rubritalea tangerina TaxID=430798 RepID=UPI00361CDD03